jgi:hypothetical protein
MIVLLLAVGYFSQITTDSTSDTQSFPTSVRFTGRGDDVQSFNLKGNGLGIFSMGYSGTSNFIVWLKDQNGNRVDLLANKIGSYSGRASVQLYSGKYYLEVKASGPWSINLDMA